MNEKRVTAVSTSETHQPDPSEQPAPSETSSGHELSGKRAKQNAPPGAPGASFEDAVESSVEKAVKEYGPPVAMAILVVVLAVSAWAFYTSRQEMIASSQWDMINIGVNNKSVSTLETTAKEAPGTFVGLVATQNAGVVELNEALSKILRDPDKAKQEIKSAITRFEQILAAPQSTEMLQDRAKFYLAYAHESLGNFDAALPYYKELAQPDHVYESLAKDGMQRSQDPEVRRFYETYSAWKPTDGGTAPGDFLQDILKDPSLPITQPDNLDLEDSPPIVPPLAGDEDKLDGEEDKKAEGAGDAEQKSSEKEGDASSLKEGDASSSDDGSGSGDGIGLER